MEKQNNFQTMFVVIGKIATDVATQLKNVPPDKMNETRREAIQNAVYKNLSEYMTASAGLLLEPTSDDLAFLSLSINVGIGFAKIANKGAYSDDLELIRLQFQNYAKLKAGSIEGSEKLVAYIDLNIASK